MLMVELDRFMRKVDIVPGSCWDWRGCKVGGYGQFSLIGGKRAYAYRLSFEHNRGPVLEGLTLDHLCRNRACVNPAHLEAVTRGENVLRGNGPPARNARKTHCQNGHEFTPDNIYRPAMRPSGWRACRSCLRAKGKLK